jgi:hypothetical protein
MTTIAMWLSVFSFADIALALSLCDFPDYIIHGFIHYLPLSLG